MLRRQEGGAFLFANAGSGFAARMTAFASDRCQILIAGSLAIRTAISRIVSGRAHTALMSAFIYIFVHIISY